MDALKQDLEDLRRKKLYRSLQNVSFQKGSRIRIGRRLFINFASNNYLGLAAHPRIARKAGEAARVWGAGSGASRLLSGDLTVHLELEKKLAKFKGEEKATVFSSGYLANLGAVTALLNEKDVVLVDRLDHASLVDAARLSRAKLWVYPHRDVSGLDKLLSRTKSFRRRLVLTDAYFSMDGTVAPLDSLLEVCRRHRAFLMIDEAHSTGVFGKNGRGLSEHFGLLGQIDVVMGTLSKALGSVGGFVAGSAFLRETLVNRSRTFIYTTAPSPAASAAALEALNIIEKDPRPRRRLWNNVCRLREGLVSLGFDLMGSEGAIIPLLIGDTRKTIGFGGLLKKEGIFAPAIRPPTVPRGMDRIRLSVTAAHEEQDLEKLLAVMKKARTRFL
ncbi:MAG: 8-amino-7-oxononanoate synthase [Candidatus Omnitrophota bacterium]